jgi:hypothetical protein
MSEGERVDRKPPVEPLKVRNSLYDGRGRILEPATRQCETSAKHIASVLKALAAVFGRDLETRVDSGAIRFFDESGEVVTLECGQAELMVQNVHLTLEPLLQRKI